MFPKNKKEKTFILRLLRAAHDDIKFRSDYEILMALNKFLIIFGMYKKNFLVTAIDAILTLAIQTIIIFRVLNK